MSKIRYETGEKPYKKGMGKQIALDYLKEVLKNTNEKKRKQKTSKPKVNKEAANKAASDLFEEIGI